MISKAVNRRVLRHGTNCVELDSRLEEQGLEAQKRSCSIAHHALVMHGESSEHHTIATRNVYAMQCVRVQETRKSVSVKSVRLQAGRAQPRTAPVADDDLAKPGCQEFLNPRRQRTRLQHYPATTAH